MTMVEGAKSVKVYTTHDDGDLPAHVKKLPSAIRRRWVQSHNYHAMDNGDPAAAKKYADENTYMTLDEHNSMFKEEGSAEVEQAIIPAAVKSTEPVVKLVELESAKTGWLDKIKSAFGMGHSVSPWLFYKDVETGRTRFLVYYSNNFQDKHKQWISDEAHKEYVEWADKTGQYPAAHYWHCGEGSQWGQCDFVAYSDGIAMASGLADVGKEHIAEALQKQQDKLKVSHGFMGLTDKEMGGVGDTYVKIRVFEISPLPAGVEANVWTACAFGSKEFDLLSDQKKAAMKALGYTDAQVANAEATAKALGEAAKSAGVAFKEDGTISVAEATTATGEPATGGLALLSSQIEVLTGTVTQLVGLVGAQAETVKAVKEAQTRVDGVLAATIEKAAEDLNVSKIAGVVSATRPSQDGANLMNKEAGAAVAKAAGAAEDEQDWITKIMNDQFGSIGISAATTPGATN